MTAEHLPPLAERVVDALLFSNGPDSHCQEPPLDSQTSKKDAKSWASTPPAGILGESPTPPLGGSVRMLGTHRTNMYH